MKRRLFFPASFFLLTLTLITYGQTSSVFISGDNVLSFPTSGDSGIDCAGGEVHDDGTFEGGVGWASVTTDGRFVIKFRPNRYPWKYNKFCIALGRVSSVTPDMTFDIVVYDSTGAGGTPGNLVCEFDTMHVTNIPVVPSYQFYSFSNLNIPTLSSGSYYIGIKYNPSLSNYMKYSANDHDCPYWPGYYWSNFQPYWTPIEVGFLGLYRCLGYRAEGDSLVGISGNSSKIPVEYALFQNYPNPFNPVTEIKYAIPKPGAVVIKVYDILGKEAATLVNEYKVVGYYSIEFRTENLSSGVYVYKLVSGYFSSQRKMVILK